MATKADSKATSGKQVAKNPATGTRASKATGNKQTAKKPATRAKSSKATKDAVYTKPELREKLKEKVKAGEKGGHAGQWSARKAQLLAAEYKKEGGDYKEGGPNDTQKHLQSWTKEKWQTTDGKKAARGKTTARYLPKKAWEKLTPAEREATDAKKKTASRTGKQFVANTAAAKKARKSATKS